jgi:hypothetical protein
MINTMADPADSNSASAGNVLFKMIRFAKIILSAKLNGLALGLLTRSARQLNLQPCQPTCPFSLKPTRARPSTRRNSSVCTSFGAPPVFSWRHP